MRTLYHEVQESKLCALHCVNTVLQGPVFSEFELAAMASDLDRQERRMMRQGSVSGDFLPEVSHNVSPDGDFSIQVLQKALEIFDLQVIPLDNPVAQPAQIEPESEDAYICHLRDHWFCLRKVNGEWYNFDSLYPAPEHLSRFYLSAYLDSLKGSGWSIFLVRGDLPEECPVDGESEYGRWLSPEDAWRIVSLASRKRSERSGRRRREDDEEEEEEEEDEGLKNAIAASLRESSSSSQENENSAESDGKRARVQG